MKIVKKIGCYEVGKKKVPLKKVVCKDIHGDDVVVNFWRKYMDQIDVGQVYTLKNLRVTDFPSDGNKHCETYYDKSEVIRGSEQDEIDFQYVSLAEGFVNGTVQLIHGVACYDACVDCSAKVDPKLPFCPKCKKPYKEIQKCFRYEVCLETSGEDDINAFNITGFNPSISRFLSKELPLPSEDIENELNDKLEGKRVRLDWNYNVKTNDQIVYSIMIVDDQP